MIKLQHAAHAPALLRQCTLCLVVLMLFSGIALRAQGTESPEGQTTGEAHKPAAESKVEPQEGEVKEKPEEAEPATDLTVFVGSDFIRPGLLPRANLNVAVGHSFHFLRRNPLGAKLTFGYTYENTGTHGFIHTRFGEHTEQLGFLRDIKFGRSERFSAYTIVQAGISSLTGDTVQNRFSTSPGVGFVTHLSRSQSIWLQELYNKVETVPWYTVSSVGYTYSF